MIKNYRIRDANGLSFSFLVVWLTGNNFFWSLSNDIDLLTLLVLLGDVANFIGCIITGQLPFQIILSIYFTIIDTILCFQWLYYVKYTDNRIRRWFDGDEEIKPIQDISLLLNDGERIYTTYSTGGGKEINEQSPLLSSSPSSNKKYVTMLLFFGFVTFGVSSPSDLFTANDTAMTVTKTTIMDNHTIWVGRFFAWVCTFLYLSSRLPQIYQNFRRRSVEGLSMALFFFAAMGNLTYVLSIFTNPHATRATMLEAVPYIIGSAGTLLFDATIFSQYALFANNKKDDTADTVQA